MSNETLNLSDKSLLKIKNISNMIEQPDLSKVVSECVDLTNMIVKKLNRGDSVFVETRAGKKIELSLKGDL